jgi:uncharacterized protein
LAYQSVALTPSLPVPTQEERTLALLAHLLQVFTGFIAPLVIYCIKQDSRFVKFHALQSLIWQLCYMVVVFGGMMLFFFSMFASVIHSAPGQPHTPPQPPTEFLMLFPLIWLFALGGWLVNMILGIVYGVKANRGEWAAYPIIGAWCLPKSPSPEPAQPWAP